MYIHKYSVNDENIFVLSERASKPSKNMTLTSQNWLGYSSGSSVSNASKFLKELSFSKEEAPKEEEKPKKKKAVSELVRTFAASIDKE